MNVLIMFAVLFVLVVLFAGLSVVVGLIKKSNRPYKDENLLHNDGKADSEFKGFNFD